MADKPHHPGSTATAPPPAPPARPAPSAKPAVAPAAVPIQRPRPRPSAASRIWGWWPFDRRWVAETFSREQLVSAFRTLLWVAPLTFLIWIYAEREQVEERTNEAIPFELVTVDPNKIVTLKATDANLIVDLEGPRARVEPVLQRLRGGELMRGLEIPIDPKNAGGEFQVPIGSLVANHDLFARNGITIKRVQPERVNVVVDQIVERDAQVVWRDTLTNLEPATAFNPSVVRVIGPQSVLDGPDGQPDPLTVYARLQGRPELQRPGVAQVEDVPLDLPDNLQDSRVRLSTQNVSATLHVRDRDTTYTMNSMVIKAIIPNNFPYDVRHEASLPNVTLIGPQDKIELLQQPGFEQPIAVFEVSSADAGQPRRKTLSFMKLPEGVRVADADRNRSITVEVVPESSIDTP